MNRWDQAHERTSGTRDNVINHRNWIYDSGAQHNGLLYRLSIANLDITMRKATLILSLIFGIGIFLISTFSTCCRDCELQVYKVQIVYINETDYDIKFYNISQKYNVKAKDTIIVNDEYEAEDNTQCPQILSYPVIAPNDAPAYFSFSDVRCDTLNSLDDPSDSRRYECSKIDAKNLRYIYRYTMADFNAAKECN